MHKLFQRARSYRFVEQLQDLADSYNDHAARDVRTGSITVSSKRKQRSGSVGSGI